MITICPICNGLEALQGSCPICSNDAVDWGRLADYYGPYSPYRPIADLSMTNGFPDLRNHQCIHAMHCASCGNTFVQVVQEIDH